VEKIKKGWDPFRKPATVESFGDLFGTGKYHSKV